MVPDPLRHQALSSIVKLLIPNDVDLTTKTIRMEISRVDLGMALSLAYDFGVTTGRYHHPNYTRIDLLGRNQGRAVLLRSAEADRIQTQIITPDNETNLLVGANHPNDQWLASKQLCQQLNGQVDDLQVSAYFGTYCHLSDKPFKVTSEIYVI